MNRRAFFGTAAAAAGAVAAAPLLAGCGESGADGTGTTSASQIAKIMPSYVPSNLIKPQHASVDGSSPGFITYPLTLVQYPNLAALFPAPGRPASGTTRSMASQCSSPSSPWPATCTTGPTSWTSSASVPRRSRTSMT